MTAWLPVAAALLAVSLWAISFVAIKVALPEMRPETMIWLRQLLGALTVALIVWLRGSWEKPARGDLPRLALAGFVGVVLHQWLQAQGMLTTTATVSAWLSALAPALMAVMAWLWLRERFMPRQALWLLLAGLGAILVSAGSWPALLRGSFGGRGDVLVLASALAWALYSILLKRLVRTRRAGTVTLATLFLGWLLLLPLFILRGGWAELAGIGAPGWAAVAVPGVGSTGLASIPYNYALKPLSGTLAAALQYPEPLLVAAAASVLLRESFTPAMAVGGLLILFGVWRVERTADRPGR
jgi:drug/metabolite transporter (DMT)-like permease